ncbi:MAG: hypothetical protein U0800_04060 [Isosphaeraceae bacterium]
MKIRTILLAILVLGLALALFGQARYYERRLREMQDREATRNREAIELLRSYSSTATQLSRLQEELKALRSCGESAPPDPPGGRPGG